MPRTRLSKIRLQVGLDPTELDYTALTPSVEYDFVFEGGEVILIQGAGSLVLESVPIEDRYGDIAYMNADAGNPALIYGPFLFPGWRQSDGTFHISMVSGTASIAILAPAR